MKNLIEINREMDQDLETLKKAGLLLLSQASV